MVAIEVVCSILGARLVCVGIELVQKVVLGMLCGLDVHKTLGVKEGGRVVRGQRCSFVRGGGGQRQGRAGRAELSRLTRGFPRSQRSASPERGLSSATTTYTSIRRWATI
jgi:hypothetical protein